MKTANYPLSVTISELIHRGWGVIRDRRVDSNGSHGEIERWRTDDIRGERRLVAISRADRTDSDVGEDGAGVGVKFLDVRGKADAGGTGASARGTGLERIGMRCDAIEPAHAADMICPDGEDEHHALCQ